MEISRGDVGIPGLTKEEIGSVQPGTKEWDEKIGRNASARDPHVRLKDMDASGIDQVMIFPLDLRLPAAGGECRGRPPVRPSL